MTQFILRLIGIATVLALFGVSIGLTVVMGQLETERLNHAATLKERDEWKATAEAYRKDAEAQAKNARTCLDREAKAALDAAERTAIMQQAKPRPRLEQEQVVDDETRNRVAGRLNRPL